MTDTINYDESEKVWKTISSPFESFINQTIGQAFMENVKKTPSDKVLERYYDLGLEKTMSDIYRESVTVAVNLRKLGVQPGDVLVLYSMVNPEVSALTMGSFLMGVTVNFFETKTERQEAEHLLELISPTLILYEEEYSSIVKEAVSYSKLPKLKQLISIDGSAGGTTLDSTLFKPIDLTEHETFVPPTLGNPKELVGAYLLTSGSTGLPKIVRLSHSLMLNSTITCWNVPQRSMHLTPESVVFAFNPLRNISQVTLMLQSLLLGVVRICVSGFPSGPYGREIIRTGRVTHFFSTPTVFQDILLSIDSSDEDALSSLHCLFLGGESPSQTVMNLSMQLAINATVCRCYGMTELSGVIASDTKVNGGYLNPELQMKILDDNLKAVGPNTNGQLFIRAPVPMLGYLKLQNSDYFDKDGFFNTGDYGFFDENKALNVVARYKSLVRANDIIIIPNEMERLVNTLPEIFSSIFVANQKSAEDSQVSGVVFVVLDDNIQIPSEEIKLKISNVLKANLSPAQYKIVKKIHAIEKYPLTTNGKFDRVKLAKIAQDSL